MSTRCQVMVTNNPKSEMTELNDGRDMWLYHHCDGYPSNMVPLIKKAFDYENLRTGGEGKFKFTYGIEKRGWEKGRVFKSASLLCAVDPCQFEPLPYQEFHRDIEYFYVIRVANENDGNIVWYLTVYDAFLRYDEEITLDKMKVIIPETKLDEITPKMYEEIK